MREYMRSECRKQGRSVRDALVAVKGVTHKAKQEECMDYTTQMDAARKGIVTPEMKAAAAKEEMDVKELMELMAKGQAIIPANKRHTSLSPAAIGSRLKTKINVNLGISRDCKDMDVEVAKVNSAVAMGAESIMDLSSYGDTRTFRRRLTSECPAIIGTVPIYDAVVYYHKPLKEITSQEWLDIVKMHAEDGVDFMTIHCGINRETAGKFKRNKRLTNIVSRGGSIIFAWMEMTGEENPFYEHYDEILDICREYDITMSLGDACRPGCLKDASDISQIEELITLGELTKRAWEKDVQVMVEGPGHMPLDQIAANMKIQQTICQGAPFYVLGPLVTDVAPGYDHITAAIGGAVAAAYGASFLCYVTPAEHLRLPDLEDVKEGIIASRIAAHAADVAKGIKGAVDWDNRMSEARKKLDWEGMFELSIDPEKARRYRASAKPEKEDTCSMCGNFCAVKNMNRILDGEIVNIYDEESAYHCRVGFRRGGGHSGRFESDVRLWSLRNECDYCRNCPEYPWRPASGRAASGGCGGAAFQCAGGYSAGCGEDWDGVLQRKCRSDKRSNRTLGAGTRRARPGHGFQQRPRAFALRCGRSDAANLVSQSYAGYAECAGSRKAGRFSKGFFG